MIEVIVVCEGRTEEAFVKEVMQPALSAASIYLYPRLISTSAQAKGGALSTDRVVRNLGRTLKERAGTYVTTLFDLYGLPTDFPGRATADTDPVARCEKIEAALHEQVLRAVRCREDRFMPYIQPYEFEALLFSDTTAFGRLEPDWKPQQAQLAAVADAADSPEHINGEPDTHPSARLESALHGYRKMAHGVALAASIGIERMRAECRHFGRWFDSVESLQPLQRPRGSTSR